MKSAVETLSPTRVRLTVEVPFEELKPSLDAAYRKIGASVRVPGFRPGHVPPRILEQRIGRAPVLEEAINEAIPRFYGEAVREAELFVLGQPSVEVTELNDGDKLAFAAEVDVRPTVELPDFAGLQVSVEDAEVTDEDLDEQLEQLRGRFATLSTAERAAADGDYVVLDLVTTVDGEQLDAGTASGISYEVGSGGLVEGLDEAVAGHSAGDEFEFETELPVPGASGDEPATRTATIKGTVTAVREKQLPDLDDGFAQLASEHDTLAELKDELRTQLERQSLADQGVQARDRALEAALERTEVPLPEAMLSQEIDYRRRNVSQQLGQLGMTMAGYLKSEDKTAEEFDAELVSSAELALQAQFLLDQLADREEYGVGQDELMQLILERAAREGTDPQAYANHMVEHNHLPELWSEIRRRKALEAIMKQVTVTDASGRTVDLDAIAEKLGGDPQGQLGQPGADGNVYADLSADDEDDLDEGEDLDDDQADEDEDDGA